MSCEFDDFGSEEMNYPASTNAASNQFPNKATIATENEQFCRLTKMMSAVAVDEYTPTANMIQSTLQYHSKVLRNASLRKIEREERKKLEEQKADVAAVQAAEEARQNEVAALAKEKMDKMRLYRYHKPYFAPNYPPPSATPTHPEGITNLTSGKKRSSAAHVLLNEENDEIVIKLKDDASPNLVTSENAQGGESNPLSGDGEEKRSSVYAGAEQRRSVTFASTYQASPISGVEVTNSRIVPLPVPLVSGGDRLPRNTPLSSRSFQSYSFPTPNGSDPSGSRPSSTAGSERQLLNKKDDVPKEMRKRQISLYKFMSGRLSTIKDGGFYSARQTKSRDILQTAKELLTPHQGPANRGPVPPPVSSAARSAPSASSLIPITLSVPEMITLRALYEECSANGVPMNESNISCSVSIKSPSGTGMDHGLGPQGISDNSNNMQSSHHRTLLLDAYHLIVLLHRSKISTVPPTSEINKIIAKILLAHLGEGDLGMSSGALVKTNVSSSRRIYSTVSAPGDSNETSHYSGTTKLPTTTTDCNINTNNAANGALEASSFTVPTSPKLMTFEMFLQAVQLAKEWNAVAQSTYDASNNAFVGITGNRSVTNDPNVYPSVLKKDALEWTATPRDHPYGFDKRSVSDVAKVDDFTAQKGALTDAEKELSAEHLKLESNNRNFVHVSDIKAILASLGMEFDFVTLLKGVDPYHFDGEHISSELFRWITGSEDPSVVQSFCTLGGEDTLSGTIPVEVLMSKCAAMNMTPQFIANFVAVVDANGDGVVDYNEFLAMILRNRQETKGYSEATKRSWSEKDLRTLKSPEAAKKGILSWKEESTDNNENKFVLSPEDSKSEDELQDGNLLDFFTLVSGKNECATDRGATNLVAEKVKQKTITPLLQLPIPKRRRFSLAKYTTCRPSDTSVSISSLTLSHTSPYAINNPSTSLNFSKGSDSYVVNNNKENDFMYGNDVFADDDLVDEKQIENISVMNAKKFSLLKEISNKFFDEDGTLTENNSSDDDYDGWDGLTNINNKETYDRSLKDEHTCSSYHDFYRDEIGSDTTGDAVNAKSINRSNTSIEVDVEGNPIYEDRAGDRARAAKHLQMGWGCGGKKLSISQGDRKYSSGGLELDEDRQHGSKVVTLGIGAVLNTNNAGLENNADSLRGEFNSAYARVSSHQGLGGAIKAHVDKLVSRTNDTLLTIRKRCRVAMESDDNGCLDVISTTGDASFRVRDTNTAIRPEHHKTQLQHTLNKYAPPTCPRLYALPEKKIDLLDAAVEQEQTKLSVHRKCFSPTGRGQVGAEEAYRASREGLSDAPKHHTIIHKPVVASRYLQSSHSSTIRANQSNALDKNRVKKYKAKKYCSRRHGIPYASGVSLMNASEGGSSNIRDGDLVFYGTTTPPSLHRICTMTTGRRKPYKDSDCVTHIPKTVVNGVITNDARSNELDVSLVDSELQMVQSSNRLKNSSRSATPSPIMSAGRVRAPRDNLRASSHNDSNGKIAPRVSSRLSLLSPKINDDDHEMIMMHNPHVTMTPNRTSSLLIRHNSTAANATQKALQRIVRSHLYMSLPAHETHSMRSNIPVTKTIEVNNIYGFREKKVSKIRPPSSKIDIMNLNTRQPNRETNKRRPNTAGCRGVDRLYSNTPPPGGKERKPPSSASRVRCVVEDIRLHSFEEPSPLMTTVAYNGNNISELKTMMYTDGCIANMSAHDEDNTNYHNEDNTNSLLISKVVGPSSNRSSEIEQQEPATGVSCVSINHNDNNNDTNHNTPVPLSTVNNNSMHSSHGDDAYYDIPDDSDEGDDGTQYDDEGGLGNYNRVSSALDVNYTHFTDDPSRLTHSALAEMSVTSIEQARNKAISLNALDNKQVMARSLFSRPQSASRHRMK